jgi:hypothetical protein
VAGIRSGMLPSGSFVPHTNAIRPAAKKTSAAGITFAMTVWIPFIHVKKRSIWTISAKNTDLP